MKSRQNKNWTSLKLSDISEIVMGQSPKSEHYNTEADGLPFFQGRSEFGYLYPTPEKWCTNPLKVAEKKNVLMTVRAPVGDLNVAREKCIIGRGLCALRSKLKSKRFLYYLLKGNAKYIASFGSGAVYDAINKDAVANLILSIPNEKGQIKVDSILSSYDDLIENNSRRIKILEQMAQIIYDEWFVKFCFPGDSKVKMVDSALGKIPEGWDVKLLSDVIQTQYGYTESSSEEEIGPKFVRGKDINKTSYIDWQTVPYCKIRDDEYPKYKLNKGDIVVIRMADPGKVGIVERDIDAVFASYLVRLKDASSLLTTYYLFYFLISDRYQSYISGASTGTTRKSASAGVLTGIKICIPPKALLEKFEAEVRIIRKLLNNLVEKNSVLCSARDILLPKLISGEIDVEDMDIDIGDVDDR